MLRPSFGGFAATFPPGGRLRTVSAWRVVQIARFIEYDRREFTMRK